MATYKVNKGDTLWKIAQKYGTTVADLAKSNNIANPDMIYIGQSITIPEKAPAPTPAPVYTPPAPKPTPAPTPKPASTTVSDYEALLSTYKDRPDSAQPQYTPPQPPMQSEAPKVPEAAVPHNDAVAEYQAMPKNSPIDHNQAYLDTFKDIQDSRGTASKPKPPIESLAGYQAMLDTYKDRPDNSPPLVTGIKQKSNDAVAEYQAMLDTYKDRPDSAQPQYTPPSPVEMDPYYQAVNEYLNKTSAETTKTIPQSPSYGTPYETPQGSQPTEYQAPVFEYPYKEEIDNLLQKVLQRPQFNYDIGNDPAYMALRDQYQAGGNLAMRDAMGNAAQLSGGYGNTYANVVGNQMYHQYLGQLNEQIPELYSEALNKYITEGNEIYKQIDSLNDANYYAQREFTTNYDITNSERDYQTSLIQQQISNDLAARKYNDSLTQQQFENELALAEYNRKEIQQQYEYEIALQKLFNDTSQTTDSQAEFQTINKMIVDAYDKGLDDKYVASMIMNMYANSPSFWEDGGLVWTIMLPDGTPLAQVIDEMLKEDANATATAINKPNRQVK